MVSPWVKEKRRLSEQGNLPADENINKKRRQTIGGVAPRNRSSQPDTLSTPLKKRISLGASASYFFSGMSKTPQSVQKSAKKKTEPIESPESGDDILSLQKDTTENLNTSFLSYASTSSEESSDIMNKSILSDTTELTASNFVLAATSRQKLADLAKIGKENFNVNSAGPKKDSAKEDIDEMPAPTPSPRSLRKLTESLRKDRLSNQEPITILDLKEEKSNLPTKTGSKLSPGQTRETSVKTLDKSKLDVSLSSMEDLFDGLLNKDSDESNASSLETSLLVSPRSNASPSIGVDDKSPIPSFKSPEMSPISLHAANDAPFLSNTKSNSATKLTPTKLNRSPRRILNPQRLDSPAKNTRNSAKKSPISKQVASDESLLSSKKNNGTVQPTAMDPEIVESLAKNTRIATLRSQVKSGDTKRKKDSVESLIPASPTYDTILSYGSRSKLALLANGSIPRSILNSAKKNFRAPDSISRKSVVFGSPEAAEYRIGSPSINLTPMPANEAKKLFSIPPDARKSDFEYSSSESTIEDETVDIEVNMSDLLQNAGVMESKSYANHLSVSSGKSDDDFNSKVASDTADIEVNLDAILRSAETNLSEERKNYLATTDDSIIKDLQEDKSIAKESIYRKMSESEVPSSILINISKESIQTENVNDSKQASVGTLEKELIASIQGTENDTRKDRVESPYAASPLMDVSTPDNLSTGTLEEQGSPKFEEGSSPSTRSNAESEAIDRQDALETRECDSNASPLIKTDTSLGDSKQGGIRGQGVSDFNEAAELEGNSSSLLKATDKIAESSPATSGIEANQSSPDQQNDEVDEQSATYVDQNEHEAERGNQKVGSNQSKTSDDEKRSPTIPGEVVPMDFSDSMSSPPKMTLPRGSEPMNESGKLSEEVDETKTIELEETMSSLLKASSKNSSSANAIAGEAEAMDLTENMSSPPKLSLPSDSSPMEESVKVNEERDETKTIELEETMSSLLKASSKNSSSANAIAGEAEAMDLTENMSSPPKLSLPSDSSPMEESMKVNEERDETNTIELEETMSSLLKASSKNSSSANAIAGEAEAMDLTENMSSPPKLSLPSDSSPMEESMTVNEERDETNTIELEETVSSLLKASSKDSHFEHKSVDAIAGEAEAMDLTENMSSPPKLSLPSDSSPMEESMTVNEERDETNTIELEETVSSLLKVSSMDSNSETKALSANDIYVASSPDSSVDYASPDAEVGAFSSDETVELETDLSSILALATQRSENTGPLPSLKLTDKFPTMASNLVPKTNRMSFGYSLLNNSASKDNTLPLDFMASPMSLIGSDRKSLGSGRKSLGSQSRFSLRKAARLSISSAGEISFNSKVDESDILIEDDEDSSSEHSKEKDEIAQSFDVTSQELMQFVDFDVGMSVENPYDTFENSILSFCVNSNTVNSTISDSIQSFAEAVCGEVEEKVAVSSDSEACYSSFLSNISDDKLKFQLWLRNDSNNSEIHLISNSIKVLVQHEWLTWEKMVADSLLNAIDQIADEYAAEDGNLTKFTKMLEEMNDVINTQKGKAAERAKQRTMASHKEKSKELRNAVEKLENEIKQQMKDLELVEKSFSASESILNTTQEFITLQQSVVDSKRGAEGSQRSYQSLKGITKIYPSSIQGSHISLEFCGSNPFLSKAVRLVYTEKGTIQCLLEDTSPHDVNRRWEVNRLSKDALAYAKCRFKIVCDVMEQKQLENADDMRCLIRQFDWTMGRLEATANELTVLQKRFDISLENDPEGAASDFLVHISFKGNNGGSLIATFELDPSYPFAPLQVSLTPEGMEVDLDSLQRSLLNNAKPGFGYLSRASDMLSAIIE